MNKRIYGIIFTFNVIVREPQICEKGFYKDLSQNME